jgi:ubiquinone/menaquinone biosynthesis C-methylase UbiE
LSSARERIWRFVRLNQRLSARARDTLVPHPEELAQRYLDRITGLILEERPALVVDVGGGRSCLFADVRSQVPGMRIVAVDASPEELALNEDVDERLQADASAGLPFQDESADLIVSRVTLEHLPDVGSFVRETARVLRPGGWCVHLFAGRNAPYALANRALPPALASRLIHLLVPGSEGRLGFRAYYDRCSPAAVEPLLRESGFDNVALEVGYEQAFYFDFFLPLYVLAALYDAAVRRLHVRGLASLVLVSAQKPRALP